MKANEPDADLQTQLEDILHAVWAQERSWRDEDRLDRVIVLAASSRARVSGSASPRGRRAQL